MKTPKQSGFVLVVGLMLLTVASGAVVSSMSVNKYQERQAGNYVRTNNYESGADEAFWRFEKNDKSAGRDKEKGWKVEVENKVSEVLEKEDVENKKPIISYEDYEDLLSLSVDARKSRGRKLAEVRSYEEESGDEDIRYAFTQPGIKEVVKLENSRVRVDFWGSRALSGSDGASSDEYNNGRDILQAVYSIGGSPDAYQDVLVGCEGVAVNGGGKINGDVRTLQPGAGVRLSGDANVDGNVTTLGALYTDSSITGNILAGGDVTLDAGSAYAYGGSIATTGSVTFTNDAPAQGNVSANGDVIFKNNAKVKGNVASRGQVVFDATGAFIYGNVESPAEVDERYVGGTVETVRPQAVSAASGGECDPQSFSDGNNLDTVMSHLRAAVPTDRAGADKDITVGSYPTVDASLTPDGLSAFDKTWNVQKDVTLAEAATVEVPTFDKPVSVIRTKDFTQKNGELNVSGGDVVLLVDGDLTLGSGGGKGLTIDQGSTLTIFVTGETHIKSSTQMASVQATTNGRSTLSLYSTHEDSGSYSKGVLIDGSAQALANVYAPYANVSVTAGGGLRGSARGKTVTVDGGGEIEYVPRSTSGGGDGSGDNGDDNSSASGWSLEGLSYGE